MRIVLPISSGDIPLLPNFTRVIQHLGGVAAHRLIIVPTLSCSKKAHEMAEKLTGVFGQVEVRPLDQDPTGGWPVASNYHFFSAAIMMASEAGPWLWLEADSLPRVPHWADAIGAAYASAASPCLGHVDAAPWRDDVTHQIMASPYGPNDTILNGVAVYPHDLALNQHVKGLMSDFAKGPDAPTEAFDVYLRSGLKGMGVSHTRLIASHWNTFNYRMEPEGLTCDSGKTHPSTPADWPIREFGGVINPDAVLIHGCKDSSLADLILTDAIPQNIVARTGGLSGNGTEGGGEVAQLRSEMGELKRMLAEALGGRIAQTDTPPQSTEKPAKKISLKGPATTIPARQDEVILTLLQHGNKRLKHASEETGISQDEIRFLASSPKSRFEITKGPSAWLKLKAS